jgi:predicted RND superfamily exporter protein
MLADAFVPIFTLSALLFIIPILAILILVFLIMKRRQLAMRLLMVAPIVLILGLGIDYWFLQSGSAERKKWRDEMQKRQQQRQDSLKTINDSVSRGEIN